jgi:glucose/arabinose dehydrogenase
MDGEQGLLGLAFHPDFAANGRLFVHYTDLQGDSVIAEFQAEAGLPAVRSASQRTLLRIEQPTSQHNGGMLAFGPDGYLYAGIGDGTYDRETGRSGTGQEPETLLGTILRLDVDSTGPAPYAVPSTNPRDAPEAPEVWAYGLRNPWRFSFDRVTGDLWIGDVGQRDR